MQNNQQDDSIRKSNLGLTIMHQETTKGTGVRRNPSQQIYYFQNEAQWLLYEIQLNEKRRMINSCNEKDLKWKIKLLNIEFNEGNLLIRAKPTNIHSSPKKLKSPSRLLLQAQIFYPPKKNQVPLVVHHKTYKTNNNYSQDHKLDTGLPQQISSNSSF